jgi:peptidoglycan/xylan/chitin deacetylase (PgdA/CDA1 family)
MRTHIIIILFLLSLVAITGCQEAAITETKSEPIPADARLVCLFFDDGYMNQYEVALPVLREHGFKATFGVISGDIGVGSGLWQTMGETELKELAAYGMDIACHTKTHPHLADNLTDEQLREEIIASKQYLESLGFEIKTMVYPYYEWDDRVIEYVKEAGFSCARGGWPEEGTFTINLLDSGSKYHLPSRQITNQDLKTFKSYVDELNSGDVICLVYHFIADDGPETTSMPVANFHEQMAYLKEAGFYVVLVSDLFE